MTPKEKAFELIELFTFNCRECDNSKISALITINEMIKMYNEMNVNGFLKPNSVGFILNDVKNEIEKL
jgi:hypothetical protein